MEKSGNKKATNVLSLLDDFDTSLSTILIGNNVVNIAAASIATIVFTHYFTSNGLTISTLVMTILVLIFGEISPKSYAKENAEYFAMLSYPILHILIIIFTPLNKIFLLLQKGISKFFSAKAKKGLTEEELKVMVDEVENYGNINKQESELIKSAIEFDDIRVHEILTPRVDIVACPITASPKKLLEIFSEHGFSRIPIFRKNIDHIVGFIHAKDFYTAYLNNQNFQLKDIIKDLVVVHKSTKISLVLKNLQQEKAHLAIVLDSYGSLRGIVSLEDILEELVGEIWDEHDSHVSVFHKLSNNSYLISCSSNSQNANLNDMFKYMHLDIEQYNLENSSISRWIINMLGKIPKKGDSFVYENLKVIVIKTNIHRVLEIKIEIQKPTI
jgi:CBS domain containing-hemolysin-like protein